MIGSRRQYLDRKHQKSDKIKRERMSPISFKIF